MRITVSSTGRFWAFDLAGQMRKRGLLMRLYTAYPRFKVNAELRPFARTFPWLLAPALLAERAEWKRLARALSWRAIESFDRWTERRVEGCDVLVHLSSFGLHTARRARTLGARVVCDRGSSHIMFQDELLADEHTRQGLRYTPIDRRIVEKELREYAEADLITVPSTFARDSFIEKGVPPEKLRRVSYGVDVSLFQPVPKEDERFRVLFVGSYSVRKGIGYLFDAVRPLVSRGHVDVWFMGCRDPEARPLLARNADCFTDKGAHPRSRLAWFYSQGSVLVLPSVEDGMGLVLAQAMACGVPVIASLNTGGRDLFSDGVEGFIVPSRDPEAIRDKIEWMLENPVGRREMGAAALRRVRQLGGWDAYGDVAAAVYEELVNGHRSKNELVNGNRTNTGLVNVQLGSGR